jgi:hypothetical protein
MRGYGTLPTLAAPPQRRSYSGLTLVIGVTVALAAAVALITVGALSSRSLPTSLLEASQVPGSTSSESPSSPPSMPAEATAESTGPAIRAPRHEDWVAYLPAAKQVLTRVGVPLKEVAEKTDLNEGCGNLLVPCLATVGSCVSDYVVTSKDKRISADPLSCQCFARGLAEPIPVAGNDGVHVSCSYQCLESIRSAFDVRFFLSFFQARWC